ncbi:RNA polymerase subunit sigma-70 [Actinomadura violacea]|uniref:RNA polymerase subunit sigma-70 n=1 Tax=Actinomadura violacea TaxID=2819934 RepID=UPI0027DD537B|nr:RNA polymerase subunit sigma-70 [Actinomadura violacea]
MIDEDFEARVAPYRCELLVHCYRMLGAVHEAEDLVRETMLRARRARERAAEREREGTAGRGRKGTAERARKSTARAGRPDERAELYGIATRACLAALEGRSRRRLPSGLCGPSDDPHAPLAPSLDVPWLQPFPDALLGGQEERAVRRGSLRLALVAAMQALPPEHRAVLILRDVLGYPAEEVAALLGTSAAAVEGALRRARADLADVSAAEDAVAGPDDGAAGALMDRYVRAFEDADVPGVVALLTEDAVLEMPPIRLWYAGRDACGRFLERLFEMRGTDWRLVRTAANAQPAVAAYHRDDDGEDYVLHTLQVFTVRPGGVARNVVFQDARVFAAFELSPVLAEVR